MNIQTAFSTHPSPISAAAEIKAQLESIEPAMVLFFASSHYDPHILAKEMDKAFESAAVFGCTTAGEIISGAMLKDSVVAMAFNRNIVQDMDIQVIEELAQQAPAGVERAFAGFENHFGKPMLEMNPNENVGIVLIDGMSGAEEVLMEKIGDLTDAPFIGGSAGDDLQFTRTYVFAHGRAYTNAAILALLKPTCEFDFIKTASFTPRAQTLVPTRVSENHREVIEFNHQPAANAYASVLGVPVEQLPDYFMTNPIGLMSGAEPYVRSPQRLNGTNMLFYCALREGVELRLLESTDIIQDTRKALAEHTAKCGPIQGLINFHCILRTLELEKKELTRAYGQLFTEIPTIGFSTYGEEYIGHVNQTSTMLVFR